MALTLIEASKLAASRGEMFEATVIELYARSSPVLSVLPFMDIDGNAYTYNREAALPGVAFRGVNEAFSESTGVINPVTETLTIAGGDLDVDRFIVQTQGAASRSSHVQMKLKAMSLYWSAKFFNGDSDVDPREFDGVKKRLAGTSQEINADDSPTAGGDALSLERLDYAIDECDAPQYLVMNKNMRRRLTAATRATGVSGFLAHSKDEFGRQQTLYNDLPILEMDYDNLGNQIITNTEPASNGGAAETTSIYVVGVGDGLVTGIQNGGIDVRDLGELDDKGVWRTRVEWYSGLAVMHPRAMVRLKDIDADAAVTA